MEKIRKRVKSNFCKHTVKWTMKGRPGLGKITLPTSLPRSTIDPQIITLQTCQTINL